jgi:hypothetical protein
MRSMILILALVFAASAWGSCGLSSARIGGNLVKVGDSDKRVVQARPDREVQLENSRGGAAGFRMDFYQRDKTIQIYVQGGRVVRICHVRD